MDFVEGAHSPTDTRTDPDALIVGTTIEAYRIAALLDGGASIEDVLRDFPSLTREQVVAAAAYAGSHPDQGRSYPSRSAKSAMRSGRGGLRRAFAVADEG